MLTSSFYSSSYLNNSELQKRPFGDLKIHVTSSPVSKQSRVNCTFLTLIDHLYDDQPLVDKIEFLQASKATDGLGERSEDQINKLSSWMLTSLDTCDDEQLLSYLLHYQEKILSDERAIAQFISNNIPLKILIKLFEINNDVLRLKIVEIIWLVQSRSDYFNVESFLTAADKYKPMLETSVNKSLALIESYYSLQQNRHLLKSVIFESDSEIIGRGGNGIIRKIQSGPRAYALKRLKPNISQGNYAFLQEMKIHTALNHPNIIELYSINIDLSDLYIIMELATEGSLYNALHVKKEPWSASLIFAIALCVADGLQYLHEQHILHGDIKTENILLTSLGVAKLTDFGCAHHLKTEVLTKHSVNGTVKFFAPEVLDKSFPYTTARDIYAFAYVLWELCTQKIPFKDYTELNHYDHVVREKQREVLSERTSPINSLITDCWAHNFSERLSAQVVANQLRKHPHALMESDSVGETSSAASTDTEEVSTTLSFSL